MRSFKFWFLFTRKVITFIPILDGRIVRPIRKIIELFRTRGQLMYLEEPRTAKIKIKLYVGLDK